ncbi:hypothetical protein P8452_43535 [Trifolium repens]|nr:hypothetical protein P8452_43535 [Trifolium repens]
MLDGPPVANENDSAKEDGVKKKKAGTSKAWKYKVLVKKLNLYVKLEGHQGCVNAVEFNSTGDVIVSAEQVQASERVYAQCPKPSSLHRQQLIRECPIFANIEPKQIKKAICKEQTRACGLVSSELAKIVEILKDRPCWFRDCRSLEVFTMIHTSNAGTIELVYMQTYAPTTLAPARGFGLFNTQLCWRMVCERSLSGARAASNPGAASQFVRAEMLSSGLK